MQANCFVTDMPLLHLNGLGSGSRTKEVYASLLIRVAHHALRLRVGISIDKGSSKKHHYTSKHAACRAPRCVRFCIQLYSFLNTVLIN